MKIISKYSDYYDYLAYQYGIDPNLVYSRLDSVNCCSFLYPSENGSLGSKIEIAFCGQLYTYFLGKEFPIWDEESLASYQGCYEIRRIGGPNSFFKRYNKSTPLNKERREPILARISLGFQDWYKPKDLKSLQFASIVGPEEAYFKMVEFLGWLKDNPAPPEILDDKQKVASHGFDIKTSFRNIK